MIAEVTPNRDVISSAVQYTSSFRSGKCIPLPSGLNHSIEICNQLPISLLSTISHRCLQHHRLRTPVQSDQQDRFPPHTCLTLITYHPCRHTSEPSSLMVSCIHPDTLNLTRKSLFYKKTKIVQTSTPMWLSSSTARDSVPTESS